MEWCLNAVLLTKKCLQKLSDRTSHMHFTAYELCVCDKSSVTAALLRLESKGTLCASSLDNVFINANMFCKVKVKLPTHTP